MSAPDDLTPKVDPLHQAPQGHRVAQAATHPAPVPEVGFVLYDPDYVKQLLATEAGKMQLAAWPLIQGQVSQMVDRLYAQGIVMAGAVGENRDFVQRQLVQAKAKCQIPVRVRALPNGVKTERA